MKKILTRLSSVLLLVTIVISAISMSGHVFAQTDRQNQNNIVDVETDENQNTKVTLQSSEESLEPTTGKTADSEQTKTSEENTQKETTENIESEENTTDSEVQQNSEENSNKQPESSLFSDRMRPSDTLTAGSLEIEDTRSLSKYDTINTLKDFTYTVSFSNLTPEKIYKYQTTSNIKYFTAESNGTAVLDLKLSKDDKVTVPMLPDGSTAVATQAGAKDSVTSYTVESTTDNIAHSADANRVVCKDLSTYSEPIAAENTKTLIFDDVMETKYTITVSKTVEGATTDQLFEFTIEFTGLKPNSTINTSTDGRIISDADGYATKSFFLKSGEKIDITGVPTGAKFTVTETGTPDYKPSCTVKADDTVLSTGSAEAAKSLTSEEATVKPGVANYTAEFVNAYSKTHSLSITKTVAGNMGDKSKAFVFAVQMPESMYGKTVMTTKPDGSPAYTQVSSTGIINFTLKHGETITFSGLTDDEVTSLRITSEYGVSEENYSKEGYKTACKTAEKDGNLSVAVTNTKTAGVPTGIHDVTGTEVMIIIGFIGLVLITLYSYSKYKDMRG